jgi:hypothetical protein
MANTPPSTTAGFYWAIQPAKGSVPVTTNWITARAKLSNLNEKFDEPDTTPEHTGKQSRPTELQNEQINMGYIVPFNGSGDLYPDLIGLQLLMTGFECISEAKGTITALQHIQTVTNGATGGTYRLQFLGEWTAAIAYNADATAIASALDALSNIVAADDVTVAGTAASYTVTFKTGGAYAAKNVPPMIPDNTLATGGAVSVAASTSAAGDYYSNVFTMSKRYCQHWGSVMQSLGDVSDAFWRKATDCRLSKLELKADSKGISVVPTGAGLSLGLRVGTEVPTVDTGTHIVQTTGSFSLVTFGGSVALTGTPRTHTVTFTQNMAEDDFLLHQFGRGDLPVNTVGVNGTLGELAGLDFATYKKIRWGGTAGTSPSQVRAVGALDFKFTSPANIPTLAVPYSLEVVIPEAEILMSNFESSGDKLIYFDATYKMLDLDQTTEPVTVTLINKRPHYTY